MIRTRKPISRIFIVVMSIMLIAASIVPMMLTVNNNVEAAGTITIFLDMGLSKGGSNWPKQPEHMYFYLSNNDDSGQHGTNAKTFVSGNVGDGVSAKAGEMKREAYPTAASDGVGYVFSVTFNKSDYKFVSFSTATGSRSGVDRTARRPQSDITLSNNMRLYVTEKDWNGYQSIWVKDDPVDTTVDYAGSTFKIANLGDTQLPFKAVFKNSSSLEDLTVDGSNHTELVMTSGLSMNSVGRDSGTGELLPVEIKVPTAGTNGGAYTKVEIYQGSTKYKEYNLTLADHKIIGKTFYYGWTKYQETKNSTSLPDNFRIDYGDYKTRCFYSTDYKKTDYPARPSSSATLLYFDKNSFPLSGSDSITVTAKSGLYSTTKLAKGNASAVTNSVVVLNEGEVFTITYVHGTETDVYNAVWDYSSSNMVMINTGKAEVKATFSLQTMGELDGQNFITVKADFFDYHYDHNVGDKTYNGTFNYYVEQSVKTIGFQDKTNDYNWIGSGGKKIYVYYWGGNATVDWPGIEMKKIKQSGAEVYYAAAIPSDTTKVIFNNNASQTPDINLSGYSGSNCFCLGALKTDGTRDLYAWNDTDVTNSLSSFKTKTSIYADAKRPYLTINEAVSESPYGQSSSYPMYLGQFWLPFKYEAGVTESSDVYSTTSAGYQRAAHNDDSDKYFVSGTSENKLRSDSGFGDVLNNFKWAANLAYRTKDQAAGSDPSNNRPYDAVAQGLVYNKLKGGMLYDPSGTYKIPYFDYSWWIEQTSFQTSQPTSLGSSSKMSVNMSDYIDYYKDGDFPFFEISSSQIKNFSVDGYNPGGKMLSDRSEAYSGTYYVFDSKEYSIRVDRDTNGNTTVAKSNLKHRDSTNNSEMVFDNYGEDGSGQNLGLFPFNDPEDGGNKKQKLHYGYGIEYEMEFFLNENGTVDGTSDGIPITFTFQGDDDVWVFLDDELILDMGGAHKNAIGEINFANKKTFISAIGNVSNTSIVSDNTADQNLDDSVITRAVATNTKPFSDNVLAASTVGKHKLRMYYMERGMLNSNLYVMFNLPMALTKYDLQVDTDFSSVNPNFLAATKAVADTDVFNFAVYNNGTTNVVGTGYTAPTTDVVNRNAATDVTEAIGRTTQLTSAGATELRQVIDDSKVYLNTGELSGNWDRSDRFPAVFMWKGSGSSRKSVFRYMSREADDSSGNHVYSVPYDDDYTNIIFLRIAVSDKESPKYWTGDDNVYSKMLNHIGGIDNLKNRSKDTDNSLDINTCNVFKLSDYVGSGSKDVNGSWNTANNILVERLVPVGGSAHTYNFNKNGTPIDGYVPVESTSGGVTYKLTDMYAVNSTDATDTSKSVTYDTRAYGTGTTNNIVSMQFGEYATFDKQFNYDSDMRVVQLDTLSAPVVSSGNYSRDSGYNDSTDRTVSKYYNTYTVKSENVTSKNSDPSRRQYAGIYNGDDVIDEDPDHINTMYSSYYTDKNYSVNNDTINIQTRKTADGVQTDFNFLDPTNASNEYVHLRQVILNEVKTTDLIISKTLRNDEDDDTTEFTFTVAFTDVYGKDTGNSLLDVTGMEYDVYDLDNLSGTPTNKTVVPVTTKSCTVKCNANQKIVIRNIPIGTKYNVQEVDNVYYTLDTTNSVNVGSNVEIDDNGSNTVTVINDRKTGALELNKVVKVNGSEFTSTKNFTATVTLTLDDNTLDMRHYPLTVKKGTTDLVAGTDYTTAYDNSTVPIYTYTFANLQSGAANKITISGLPAAVNYSISETADNDYTTSYDSNQTGRIRETGKADSSGKIASTITNNRKTGSLELSKELVDNNGDPILTDTSTDFSFEVTLGLPADLTDYDYTGIQVGGAAPTRSGNVITVTLKAGDTKTITGLPYGTTYTVAETDSGSYTYFSTVYSDDLGKIISLSSPDDTVTITNKSVPIVMPSTGGTLLIYLFPFGITAIAISIAALLIYKKKFSTVEITDEQGRYDKHDR